jgi:hypothetical protein
MRLESGHAGAPDPLGLQPLGRAQVLRAHIRGGPGLYRLESCWSQVSGGLAERPIARARSAWSCPSDLEFGEGWPARPAVISTVTRVRIPYPPQRLISESSIAMRVSEVANVSAGLVPVGPCLAASSLCHSSRRHEGLSPWGDDCQPGRHGSTETSHRGGPARTSLLSGYQSPFPGDKLRGGDAAGERQQFKMMCASSQMACAAGTNGVRDQAK